MKNVTEISEHKFNYEWNLADGYPAPRIEYHGSKVFSCFACGGGSSMGYKLAGYDVIGCNEIDPRMAECYKINHNPKHCFIEPIQDFKLRKDLPKELYELDILDGSPPCSSFSMAGNREKDWGKDKIFREGQSKQVLDTLFFDFIDLAKELQPKIVVAENVKGLMQGEAKEYLYKIHDAFVDAGYKVCFHLLDASKMGVPQRRERVFFIAIRNDLADKLEYEDMFNEIPYIDLLFNEKSIKIKDFYKTVKRRETQNYSESRFGDILLNINKPANTLATINRYWIDKENLIDENTIKKIGSYPVDYNFCRQEVIYLTGMSVPPVMTAQISHRIYEQWIKKTSEVS